jgi:hypothetical protein
MGEGTGRKLGKSTPRTTTEGDGGHPKNEERAAKRTPDSHQIQTTSKSP